MTFNNLGGNNLVNIRVGRIDPSATFRFSTLRQQLILSEKRTNSSTSTVQRAGLFPLAASAKVYGLYNRSALLSHPTPSLYNAVAETGIEVVGTPLRRLVHVSGRHPERCQRSIWRLE